MLGRLVLWVAEKERTEKVVSHSKLTRAVVDRFVAGNDLEDAIQVIKELNSRGIGGILDLLGEGVSDPRGAAEAAEEYRTSIRRIDETGVDTTVAIKPTQLGLAFDKAACIEYVRMLAREAQDVGTYIEIDIEQFEYISDTLEVFTTLREEFPDLRVAIQAYMRRTPFDLDTMAAIPPKIRLVKGAYSEPPELAFQTRKEIDAQYRFLTDWLFEHGRDPAIASHDTKLLDHAKKRAGRDKRSFEIQMLYGIRREFQEQLARDGYRVRVYVPFGSSWYPYLMRRIAERPANLWFFMRAVVRD